MTGSSNVSRTPWGHSRYVDRMRSHVVITQLTAFGVISLWLYVRTFSNLLVVRETAQGAGISAGGGSVMVPLLWATVAALCFGAAAIQMARPPGERLVNWLGDEICRQQEVKP